MRYSFLLIILFAISCASTKLPQQVGQFEFPIPVDTHTRPIEYQEKKTYKAGTVSASNEFPAARLNNFFQINEKTYRAVITAENVPINPSPWYAFHIWSERTEEVELELTYPGYGHRYYPVISKDGEHWENLDSSRFTLWTDRKTATLRLPLSNQPLWVAAQEVQDHRRVGEWVRELGKHPMITVGTAGQSALGRDLYYLNISDGSSTKKPAIVVISRQHPPEVTGYLAMKAFMERLIEEGSKNGFLKKFRILLYPMINPDGVDLGHFRHNTGGIDLNRDWGYYRQPETRQITAHITKEAFSGKNEVFLGLDFHSTQEDVYYTFTDDVVRKMPGFTIAWLEQIRLALQLDDINNQPSPLNQPISKGWFVKQFGAESVTYEIGDDTPREFIKVKGQVSADTLMDLLMRRSKEWGL